MLNGSNVISLQISTADIMQQIVWIGSSSIRTVRTFVPEPGIPGILGVRVTPPLLLYSLVLGESLKPASFGMKLLDPQKMCEVVCLLSKFGSLKNFGPPKFLVCVR